MSNGFRQMLAQVHKHILAVFISIDCFQVKIKKKIEKKHKSSAKLLK